MSITLLQQQPCDMDAVTTRSTHRFSTPKLLRPLFAAHPSMYALVKASLAVAHAHHPAIIGFLSPCVYGLCSSAATALQTVKRSLSRTASVRRSCWRRCWPPIHGAQRQAAAATPEWRLTGDALEALARTSCCCSRPNHQAESSPPACSRHVVYPRMWRLN